MKNNSLHKRIGRNKLRNVLFTTKRSRFLPGLGAIIEAHKVHGRLVAVELVVVGLNKPIRTCPKGLALFGKWTKRGT